MNLSQIEYPDEAEDCRLYYRRRGGAPRDGCEAARFEQIQDRQRRARPVSRSGARPGPGCNDCQGTAGSLTRSPTSPPRSRYRSRDPCALAALFPDGDAAPSRRRPGACAPDRPPAVRRVHSGDRQVQAFRQAVLDAGCEAGGQGELESTAWRGITAPAAQKANPTTRPTLRREGRTTTQTTVAEDEGRQELRHVAEAWVSSELNSGDCRQSLRW